MASLPIPPLDLTPEIDALQDQLDAAIRRVVRSGQFILGPEVEAFEAEVAAFLGVRHAVALNSGTDALVIGLRALGIGPGDQVLTTPFSFFATAESASLVGAEPVFVDIDPHTLNLDPSLLEAAVTPRTRAIVPVHLFGRPADMDAVLRVAQAHGLEVLEDAAQAFGARVPGPAEPGGAGGAPGPRAPGGVRAPSSHDGHAGHAGHDAPRRRIGSLGDAAAFSFFPTKNLGAFGDAGLLATDDDAVAEQARLLRVHGSRERYHHETLGYNSRMDALQAAVLRVKLPHVDGWNAQRRAAARRYGALLEGVAGVLAPDIPDEHVVHQYTVRVTGGRRDAVRARMQEMGVGTMIYYPIPQDRLPMYAERAGRCPHSDAAAAEVLSLPLWPSITEAQQARVVEALRRSLSQG